MEMAIAVITTATFVIMFLRANHRFGDRGRLPMQWSLSGSVNWTAPRRIALAFIPVLGTLVVFATLALVTFLQPRPGQEGLRAPAMLFVSVTFVASYALHLWLIGRTDRNGGS